MPTSIEAEEAEEVGIEHLLRDVPQAVSSLLDTSTPTPSTLPHLLRSKLQSLRSLRQHLQNLRYHIQAHLKSPQNEGRGVALDPGVALGLQSLLATMPRVQSSAPQQVLQEATRKLMVGTVVSEVVRAVQALHDCIDNKLAEQQQSNPVSPTPAAASVASK